MKRLWLVIYPELGQFPEAERKEALRRANLGDFDGIELAETLYDRLPSYAIPLFIRIVDQLEATSTFKSRKVDLRDEAYGEHVDDPLFVLGGRREGYIPYHDAYPAQVAAGEAPKG